MGRKAKNKVNLFKAILEAITLPGEIVLDQFAGSGNLGIAASITGRISILIEKSKEYVCKILKNINDNGFRTCFDSEQVGWEL
ncbi:DNA methyltransferase [Clostridium homopropionicum]|nr:DNA methyltransferase [Clostridium homopropionicum]